MFCFPMTSGLFDLSISHVVEEENVQGRYQANYGINSVYRFICLVLTIELLVSFLVVELILSFAII